MPQNADDEESYSLIRRAAALLKEKTGLCTTPGARYQIRMQGNMVACAVRLPDDLGITISEALDEHPYVAPWWEDEVHDMMQNAVEKIVSDLRSYAHVKECEQFWRDNPKAKRLPDHLMPKDLVRA